MFKVIAVAPFKFSPDGIQVVEVAKGDVVELSDEMLAVAEAEGWAKAPKKAAKASSATAKPEPSEGSASGEEEKDAAGPVDQ